MTDSSPTPSSSRVRILDQAIDLFADHGFAAVSMQQIADAAGITKATLYHHFRDKEALFIEAMKRRFAASEAAMDAALTGMPTFRDYLTTFTTILLGEEHAEISRLIADMKQVVSEEERAAFWGSFVRPWERLEEPIRRGMASGELRDVDPALASRMVFAAVMGTMQMSRFAPGSEGIGPEASGAMVDIVLRGLVG